MSSTNSLPTIAVFGGTSGTGLSTLKPLLSSGYNCNVLARTPSKLSELQTQYLETLHITKGDIRDGPAIKSTLTLNKRVVDIVISTFGMVMSRKGLGLQSNDPTICEDGVQVILNSISELETTKEIIFPSGGPKIVALSTTGISEKGRDIPIAMIPMYYCLLSVPHADKKKMEKVIQASGRKFVIVRPSLLVDGEAVGLGKVRTSAEGGQTSERPAIGYTIRRDDVALWTFEELVKGGADKWAKWEGKIVAVTY